MRKKNGGRYAVTGAGLDNVNYADFGPALSRTVTEASKSKVEGSWYVRDLDGTTLAYSDRDEDGRITTHQLRKVNK